MLNSPKAPSIERARLERDAMAWPPAAWERPLPGWRQDVDYGPEPFVSRPAARPVGRERVRRGPATGGQYGVLLREILETVLLTALIFVGIRLVVQNFRIEGGSMEPTLHSGQYLLVNKISYRLLGAPQRGDIIVFQAWGQEKDFIKRVVGRPGDVIEIRDNRIYVNGSPLDEPYLRDGITNDTLAPKILGDDEFFVLGDNRNNSSDSRGYGPLPGDRIIGKAWLTYWPYDQIGLIPDHSTSFAATSR